MLKSFSLQASGAGLLAAFVGFSSSFAVIIEGLTAVGASPAEAASGLMALSIAMGVCAIFLSLKYRMPISVAWSTPGAALLAASVAPAGGFSEAVGAFIVTAALIVAAGLWKPLGRWVAAIPAPLANAMLAGVLLHLCLAPVRAVAELPLIGLSIVAAWAAMGRINKLYAIPVTVLVAVVLIGATTDIELAELGPLRPEPVLLTPSFSLASAIGIALPLFLVTMASQNIPGMAVLNANGYRPSPGPLFGWTGLFGLFAAPFGGHAVNLAAITAALCANEEVHPDTSRRFWAAVVAGAVYILVGFGAGAVIAFVSLSPPNVVEAIAGLALLGPFGAAMMAALSEAKDREAAIVTFLVTASGVIFFGISGAFWGLVAGGAMWKLGRWQGARKA